MGKTDGMVTHLESDFGTMKLPIPVPNSFICEHPEEWREAKRALTDYMDVMWRNGFNFK